MQESDADFIARMKAKPGIPDANDVSRIREIFMKVHRDRIFSWVGPRSHPSRIEEGKGRASASHDETRPSTLSRMDTHTVPTLAHDCG